MQYLILLSFIVAPAIHFYALLVSRRGRSGAHSLAFWGGILGLLSVPAAIVAAVAYLPFSIAGAGDHPISWIAPATLIALIGLAVVSLSAAAAASRRPAV